MPFTPKQLGLSLDRGSHNPPQLRVMTNPANTAIQTRSAVGLVVVTLKSFQPNRGIFHMRNHTGEKLMDHSRVEKILTENKNSIDLFMGDLLVYQFGSYAVCIYNTFAIGKGSRIKWESVQVSGGFTIPRHIRTSLVEAAEVFGKIGKVSDEELVAPNWAPTPYKPPSRRGKRRKARKPTN